MKDYLPLEWQELPRYESGSLFGSMRKSAREHGYRCSLWFGLVRLKDHWFNNWSMRVPWGGVRKWLQRKRGVKIGKNVHWGTNVVVDYPFPNFVVVEDGASISGNDYLLAHCKPLAYHEGCSESHVAPVIVHKHAWIAINVTILPGVEIGEGAIVSAGSVVSKDIPPFTVANGNPAKVVADIAELVRKNYAPEDFERLLQERKKKYKI
ncbi:MAG: acyltransferase [Bacteroidales bacterium]|nr:acyltransferase [Bacteroidales bacterium]